MAAKSGPTNRSSTHRNATVQWVAIGVVLVLAVLAAFVFFGGDSTGTGHLGLPSLDNVVALS